MACPRSQVDWCFVDWSKTDMELARELGMHRQTIAARRRREAAGTGRKRYAWDTVRDWTMSNHEIAAMLGCSSFNVAAHRYCHGIPGGRRKPGSGLWKRRWSKPA